MEPLLLHPIAPADYLMVYLVAAADGRRTGAQLAADLKARLRPQVTTSTLEALEQDGRIETTPKVTLTAAGKHFVEERFGKLPADKKALDNRVAPALCFGLQPMEKAAARLTRPEVLRALILARLYGLRLDAGSVTANLTFAGLFTRAVAGRPPPPAPSLLKEAAASLTLEVSDADQLRRSLLRLCLALGERVARAEAETGAASSEPEHRSTEAPDDLAAFAGRVLDITRTAHGGPFRHKTPIALIYDRYGQRYADAGSLASFKERLLAASTAGHLALLPLDDPRALDDENRQRSEITTATERLHFVERGS